MTNIRKQAEDEARLIIQYYHDTGHIDDLADALEVKMREIEACNKTCQNVLSRNSEYRQELTAERSLSDSLAEALEVVKRSNYSDFDFKTGEYKVHMTDSTVNKIDKALKTYKQQRGE